MGRLHTRYAPVRRSPAVYCYTPLPLDLHVLSLPLAFILSQDQTLRCRYLVFFFSSKYFSVRQVRRNLASYCVCLDLRHILQVGIDTETFLIELSLYLSQPDTSLKCPAACLVAKCHCSFAIRNSVSARFSHPCCRVVFPERGCKVIAKSGAVQIFLRLFLKQ